MRNPHHNVTSAGSDTRTVTPSALPSSPIVSSHSPTKKSNSALPSSSGPASQPTSSSASNAAIGSQPLIVLNDTTTPHLARNAAQRFQGGGWNVTSYDEHYQNVIASTVVYYDPATPGAKRAANALQKQFPDIKRVAPRFAPAAGGDPLPTGPVVVVLTSDYTP
ncbi:MAG TPA: LytR C-terminal domain-containing protein [Jatrophihabitantaceae bacterium]